MTSLVFLPNHRVGFPAVRRCRATRLPGQSGRRRAAEDPGAEARAVVCHAPATWYVVRHSRKSWTRSRTRFRHAHGRPPQASPFRTAAGAVHRASAGYRVFALVLVRVRVFISSVDGGGARRPCAGRAWGPPTRGFPAQPGRTRRLRPATCVRPAPAHARAADRGRPAWSARARASGAGAWGGRACHRRQTRFLARAEGRARAGVRTGAGG